MDNKRAPQRARVRHNENTRGWRGEGFYLGNHKMVQKMIRGGGLACICMVGDGQGVGGNPGNNRTNPEINRTTRLGVDLTGGGIVLEVFSFENMSIHDQFYKPPCFSIFFVWHSACISLIPLQPNEKHVVCFVFVWRFSHLFRISGHG